MNESGEKVKIKKTNLLFRQLLFFLVHTIIFSILLIVLQKLVFWATPFSILQSAIISAFIISIIAGIYFYKRLPEGSAFTAIIVGMVYLFAFVVFSVFSSVFIDRSLTYHILFYAIDHEQISIQEVENLFSAEVYQQQRFHDLENSGYIQETEKGVYEVTTKGRIVSFVLRFLGEFWGIEDTYYKVEAEVLSHSFANT